MIQYARLIASLMLGGISVVWASGAAAQQKPPPRAAIGARTSDISPERLKELFIAYQQAYEKLFFTGKAQECSSSCTVLITLKATTVDGKDYCIATVPDSLEFGGTSSGNQPKTITWTLSTGNLLGRTVEFHDDYGILKVDDGKKQIVPDPHRTSPTVFEGTNKHKLKGTSTYVPVIIFRTVDGIPELCAAGDPKIVNN